MDRYQVTRRVNVGTVEVDILKDLVGKMGVPSRVEIYVEGSADVQYKVANGVDEWQLAPSGIKTNIVGHKMKGLKVKSTESSTIIFGARF